MIVNLHTHSFFSDGNESPETVVQLASESGIELLSLTDHDTFEGYDRFIAECNRLNMPYIKGVEISAIQHEIDYYSEILAYFPNGGGEQIEPLLERVRLTEKERMLRAIQYANERFKSYNYSYLKQMKNLGLWGIEIHTYRYLPQADEINNIIKEWSKIIGLNLTYGSDFHGKLSVQNKIVGLVGDFEGFKYI